MHRSPYGSWVSPITSELIVQGSIGLSEVALDGDAVYWTESRPQEKGRRVVVRWRPDQTVVDVVPAGFNARDRVHEYGGGAYSVRDGVVVFSNDADRRVYRVDGNELRPLTSGDGLLYADFAFDTHRSRLICIREDQRDPEREAVNTIAEVALDGSDADGGGRVLVSGCDFYSTPRVSPDGRHLAWLSWNHPNMPWDGCELWVGEFGPDGDVIGARRIAGGESESIFQPEWAPGGALGFVSDRSGWWNLYRWVDGTVEALCPMEAEFGMPMWVFGMRTYGWDGDDRIISAYQERGQWAVGTVAVGSGTLERVPTPFTEIDSLVVQNGIIGFIGGSPTMANAVYRHDLRTGDTEPLKKATSVWIDPGYISTPEAIEFPTEGGLTAHGFYYPPTNKDFLAPDGELPPLVVLSHGGPTSSTHTNLSLNLQYWTSRGFAVLDVNYGGSTGYGRAYRDRLRDNWGIVDVDDCVNGARALVERGLVDGDRLTIRGWSASGYTTLAALAFRDVFKAGASHYGISELEIMAVETHKFESRYLDGLIGPYPAAKAIYHERSPINAVEKLSCPLILFQGLEDKVVPPNQAQMMYDAVKAKGLPVALVMFEGEQHGFRQADNIRRALDGEFYFLSRVFGFTPAERIEPVPIANL